MNPLLVRSAALAVTVGLLASATFACTGAAAGAPAGTSGGAAAGDEPPDPSPELDNPAGSSCYTEKDCTAGTYCLVATNDPEGICTPFPDACASSPSCECFEQNVQPCLGKPARCAMNERRSAVYACGQVSPADDRGANETCSRVVGCATNLFCFLPGTPPGLCLESPPECDSARDCECLERQLGSACLEDTPTPFCSKRYGPATLECR